MAKLYNRGEFSIEEMAQIADECKRAAEFEQCAEQAKRVSRWFKSFSCDPHLIVGSVPPGPTNEPAVRLALTRGDDSTTVVWADVPYQLARIPTALLWIVNYLRTTAAKPNQQLHVPIPLGSVWRHVLHEMGFDAVNCEPDYDMSYELVVAEFTRTGIMHRLHHLELLDEGLNQGALQAALDRADREFGL